MHNNKKFFKLGSHNQWVGSHYGLVHTTSRFRLWVMGERKLVWVKFQFVGHIILFKQIKKISISWS